MERHTVINIDKDSRLLFTFRAELSGRNLSQVAQSTYIASVYTRDRDQWTRLAAATTNNIELTTTQVKLSYQRRNQNDG